MSAKPQPDPEWISKKIIGPTNEELEQADIAQYAYALWQERGRELNNPANSELHMFIDNEIELGFSLLRTAKITNYHHHRMQCLRHSAQALELATRFLKKCRPGIAILPGLNV